MGLKTIAPHLDLSVGLDLLGPDVIFTHGPGTPDAFLALLAERRMRLLQQREDIEAVLAEIDGIERECRRRLKAEARGERAPARQEAD
jgi:hypothetical protein